MQKTGHVMMIILKWKKNGQKQFVDDCDCSKREVKLAIDFLGSKKALKAVERRSSRLNLKRPRIKRDELGCTLHYNELHEWSRPKVGSSDNIL